MQTTTHPSHKNAGFTLVELAIVLVIIGLIIGGVLTGQQIIQNARVTKALNDIQAYQAQFQTYSQNYGALAGDDSAASSRFPASALAATSNGDGNGVIGGSAFDSASGKTKSESLLVWAHLRAAGLVRNQVTNDNSTAIQPPNPFNGLYGIQNGAFSGVFSTPVLCLSGVPVSAAEAIDSRLDDGLSNSGSIQASTGGADDAVTKSYGEDKTYTLCIRM